MKRIFDIILTLVMIPVIIIPVIIFIILSFLSIGRFPIITQERMITLTKKRIKIFKIRTIKNSLEFNNLKSSKTIFYKYELEQYVPSLCMWLRKSGMDEILQVYNVLKGEMSLVGPRPFCEDDMKVLEREHPDIYQRRCKLNSKPGLTGYWQINCKREQGADNLILMDEFYEQHKSIVLDFKIIIKTFPIILSAKHSDSIIGDNFKANVQNLSYSQPPINNN